MEPKLTPQSEAILGKLRIEAEAHRLHMSKNDLTDEERVKIRRGLALVDSFGILTRFIIGLAAMAGAITALFNFWPGGK